MASVPLYRPPPGLRTYLDDFRDNLSKTYNLTLKRYDDLHSFSVERPNDFWLSLWKYLNIKASVQPTTAVDDALTIDQFPRFFETAKLNFAENMLSKYGNDLAIKAIREDDLSNPTTVTWDQLRELVRSFADALIGSGFQKGDVITAIGSNNPTSLALLLATAAVGGIFSSFATDAGERALLDRLGQLRPRFLFSERSYTYNGKQHDVSQKATNVFTHISKPAYAELICTSTNAPGSWTSFETFLQRGTGRPLSFEQVAFNTPLVVMFSSGTTGTPKGIVHSHGGLVVNGKKEHLLHNNFDSKDIYYHYTNIGWTLWNIMIGALFCGSTLVLYDGSPFYPSGETCLRAILSAGTTAFGAGPRYYSELQKANVNPRPFLQNLDFLLSTGAVLTPALSSWLASAFGPLCQISFSGGTELCGSFVHGTRTLPTYAGEITVKALGMDVDVFSPEGKPLPPGESGELVCKKPFPNMPVCFWDDPQKKRYFNTYFAAFPRVWTHGDFIKINPETKGLYVLGRSDGTLNPSGVRFGSSEMYTLLERSFPDHIQDAICVSQQRSGDESERVFLFVRIASGRLTPNLDTKIREQITKDLSRRHVPQYIFAVETIPYNANGKKLEIPLKAVISQGEVTFTKSKFAPDEADVLRQYLKYFEVEKMTSAASRRGAHKL